MPAGDRILVIEDEERIRELLTDFLGEYEVEFATCQEEAFERLRSGGYHAVLLDLRLPVGPTGMATDNEIGKDILREIRKKRLKKHSTQAALPVVVMTAYEKSAQGVSQILADLGADNYVTKPLNKSKLIQVLDDAILGRGPRMDASTAAGALRIRLALDPKKKEVLIENFPPLTGAHYELLEPLCGLYKEDLRKGRSPEKFQRLAGKELVGKVKGVGDDASLRKRVDRFRKRVGPLFEKEFRRTLRTNDIIDNDWKGYRLNPHVIHLLNPKEIRKREER